MCSRWPPPFVAVDNTTDQTVDAAFSAVSRPDRILSSVRVPPHSLASVPAALSAGTALILSLWFGPSTADATVATQVSVATPNTSLTAMPIHLTPTSSGVCSGSGGAALPSSVMHIGETAFAVQVIPPVAPLRAAGGSGSGDSPPDWSVLSMRILGGRVSSAATPIPTGYVGLIAAVCVVLAVALLGQLWWERRSYLARHSGTHRPPRLTITPADAIIQGMDDPPV